MGLGHLRRSTNIAREFLKREPEGSVLVVADSPAAPFFLPPHGVDYIKLPTIVKTGDSTWRPANLGLTLEETLQIRSHLIEEAFLSFRPDVVLVDHMPVGALGELRPMLDRIKHDPSRPRLFLGLRDILDRPDVVERAWEAVDAYEYLKQYEAVLVYGSPEIHDSAAIYGFAGRARRVINCNYVAIEVLEPSNEPGPAEPMILVMGGGGADLFSLADTFVAAMPMIMQEGPVRAVLLPGPNMPPEQLDRLVAKADGWPIEVPRGFEDATPLLRRASAVVMMAGYNSMCEVLSLRRKALVIPRPGPSAEQRIRTRLFTERQLIHSLDPDDLTPERLAASLIGLLADDVVPNIAAMPPLDGAERAAEALLEVPVLS